MFTAVFYLAAVLATAAGTGAGADSDATNAALPRGARRKLAALQEGKEATEHTLSLIYNRYEMFDPSLMGAYLLRPFVNTDL
jgi:hypothetical protein